MRDRRVRLTQSRSNLASSSQGSEGTRVQLMDPNEGDRRAAALERILEISPVAPPSDSIEEFQAIASEFGFEGEELAALIEEFLDHHGIDPEGPPPIAILRSGYQVLAEGDDCDVMDSLVNGIVGESIQAASEGQPDWDDWFARLHDAFAKEVEHATRTVHVDTARALLRELLGRRVSERSDELIRGAFPHLRAGAAIRDAMEDFVPALKQGAVLILGKDSDEGLELLHRISDLLEQEPRLSRFLETRTPTGAIASQGPAGSRSTRPRGEAPHQHGRRAVGAHRKYIPIGPPL